jgi:hypothetical protein
MGIGASAACTWPKKPALPNEAISQERRLGCITCGLDDFMGFRKWLIL